MCRWVPQSASHTTSIIHIPVTKMVYIRRSRSLPASRATMAKRVNPKVIMLLPPKAQDRAPKTETTTCAFRSSSAYSLAVW